MNSSSQDAQSQRPDSAPRVDQSFREAASSELIDVVDPTEDLANDVTSELPGAGTSQRAAPPPLTGSESIVANDETADVATALTTGSVLRDRYVLGPPLGCGGTSVVYRAHDLRRVEAAGEGADVAIKLLRPQFRDRPRCIARLQREFQQTQSLAHPNVVRFYDLDCDRGNWFIAMELLVGESLGRRMRRTSPAGLLTGEALRIAVDCCDALACAHDHGVTHGDIKPDNVFVTASGEIRILDFGVAPESLEPQTLENQAVPDPLLGAVTRAYASPEVLSGQVPEARDDVFSLACLIYEMLAGKHPYGRRGADQARASGVEVERLSGVSMSQWRALAAGLAWERQGRPQIRELLCALSNDPPEPAAAPAEIQSAAPAVAAATPPMRVVQGQLLRQPSRRWLGPAALGLAVIFGVLIGRFAFDTQRESRNGGNALPASVNSTAGNLSAGGVAPTAENAASAPQATPIQQPAAVLPVNAGERVQATPGLVAFESGTMTVSRRAIVAPVPVRHFSTARRSVTVAWRVLDGTAVAGRDYGGPQSGVARFSEGHTFRMIFVPLVGNNAARGNRSFTVELTDVSPGANLGLTHRIDVTIQDDA